MHGGQGASAMNKFKVLGQDDKARLLSFMRSLRAEVNTTIESPSFGACSRLEHQVRLFVWKEVAGARRLGVAADDVPEVRQPGRDSVQQAAPCG
jgi:hypothetical protein